MPSGPAQSSSALRSRKLDPKKPLGVYRYDQVTDLDEAASRAIPRIATGVEKEEEEVTYSLILRNIIYKLLLLPIPHIPKSSSLRPMHRTRLPKSPTSPFTTLLLSFLAL
jgi:hypothetical protein